MSEDEQEIIDADASDGEVDDEELMAALEDAEGEDDGELEQWEDDSEAEDGEEVEAEEQGDDAGSEDGEEVDLEESGIQTDAGEDPDDAEGEEPSIPRASLAQGESTGKTKRDKTPGEKRNLVEAALFVAARPVSIDELATKTELTKKEVQKSILELHQEYATRETALEIVQTGADDTFSLQLKPVYNTEVRKFSSGGLIPEADMRTLTIIAIKQPIPKATLIKLRGQGAYKHVKFLLDRGFIKEIKKGRSSDLSTTDQFADTFGLSRDVNTLKKQLMEQLGVKPQ